MPKLSSVRLNILLLHASVVYFVLFDQQFNKYAVILIHLEDIISFSCLTYFTVSILFFIFLTDCNFFHSIQTMFSYRYH